MKNSIMEMLQHITDGRKSKNNKNIMVLKRKT
jgi:hypothetical protein